jgi:hypothetical protein
MQITSVVCSVHQGSRISCMSSLFRCVALSNEPSHLTQLSSRLASLSLDASFHSEILSFTSSLLTAGDMAMSAGPGRAFVIRALGVPPLGCYVVPRGARLEACRTSFPSLSDSYPPGIRAVPHLASSRVSTKYRKAGRGRYCLETQCR